MKFNVEKLNPLSFYVKVWVEKSQNFSGKFVKIFITLGFKILKLFRLKVLFEADIIKG